MEWEPDDDPITAAEMRDWEARAVAAGDTWRGLMERAGTGVAQIALEMLGEKRGLVLVLVGPGNNGGDGLVVAERLHAAGCSVQVYLWKRAERKDDWPLASVRQQGIGVVDFVQDFDGQQLRSAVRDADLIVDGFFGSGVNRALPQPLQAVFAVINTTRRCSTLAIDLPSGINADSGAIEGAALQADVTAATGFRKWGHVRGAGRQLSGIVRVVPL
ncbi:MAG: hypothetical protein NVS2B7_03300 [Herpetosiphon sp.]